MSSAQFIQEPATKNRSYVTNFTHWAKTTITNLPRPFAISAAPPPSPGQNLPTSMCDSSSSEEEEEEEAPPRHSFASSFAFDEPSAPCSFCMSPTKDPNMAQASACPNQSRWDDPTSCYPSSITPTSKSPWTCHMITPPINEDDDEEEENEKIDLSATTGTSSFSSSKNMNRLMGSLVREEGHIYSLAASGDLLYTGSDSKNIRVWKNQREYSGFKANSGLVKSIVISGEGGRIFTGHQDGKIRVWKVSSKNPTLYKRVATLPTLKAYIKSSMKPSSYVEVSKKNHRNAPWNRHYDAISSLSLTEDQNYLYSASWDQTVKVWKVSNFKCMESISAHDDAVNAVISAFDGLVFTGSADGSVKVWRREYQGKGTKHFFSQSLLKQECAVTALAVDPMGTIVYCGSSDGMVNYWQRNHLSLPSEHLRAHPLAVLCMATAGRLLFTGSADMNVGVWRRDEKNTHMFVSMLTGHSAPIKCLAVERDVKEESTRRNRRWILYSGSLDKSVKMWRVCDQAVAETPPPGLGKWWG